MSIPCVRASARVIVSAHNWAGMHVCKRMSVWVHGAHWSTRSASPHDSTTQSQQGALSVWLS